MCTSDPPAVLQLVQPLGWKVWRLLLYYKNMKIFSLGGGCQRFFHCNIGFWSSNAASIIWQYVLNNIIAVLYARHNIVFVEYSYLIDTKNLLIPFRVHARDVFSDFSLQ